MTRYVVIAVLVVLAAVRVTVRRRRRSSSSAPTPRHPDGPLARAFGATGLVASREIRERLRGRMFRVVTVILFVVVGAAVIIPTLHSSSTNREQIAVVNTSTALNHEIHALARANGFVPDLVTVRSLALARADLRNGDFDFVVVGDRKLLVDTPVNSSTSNDASLIEEVASTLGALRAYASAGLTPQQAAIVAGAHAVPVVSLTRGAPARTASESTALIGVILIFIVLTQYLTWTLMGVMEEKASRVVEVLLATVKPRQLLGGKVAGIGVVALVQALALVCFALVLAKVVGSSIVHGAAPWAVASALVWLVLGYAFYSWVYAAAGSLAERQDQVQSLALPLSAPLIFGYIVSLVGASSGSPSSLVKVLAYLPPTAPFAMTTLVGFGEASWWQFALSVGVSLACTALVAQVASRVYRAAVLRTGGRVKLRELFGAAH